MSHSEVTVPSPVPQDPGIAHEKGSGGASEGTAKAFDAGEVWLPSGNGAIRRRAVPVPMRPSVKSCVRWTSERPSTQGLGP